MNKTVTVNLGGTIFNIEEDAFLLLQSYLERIKLNFSGDPGENEIMSDIEVRLAELFNERLDELRNVVIRRYVEEVIAVMGQPEDFNVGSGAPLNAETTRLRHNKRRIYRDSDDAMIGGVCAGLSHHFGWDPLILRIIFVAFGILSGGTAVIAYFIFWALIPSARTTAEKLQMKGETVNVENIRKFVNEEAKNAGNAISGWGSGRGAQSSAAGSELIRVIGLILSKVFGAVILLIGFGLLVGLISLFFFAEFRFFGAEGMDVDQMNRLIFSDTGSYWMIMLGALLVIGIPAIAFIYGGIKLILGSTRRIKGLGWSLAALFVLGTILASISGIRMAKEFSRDAELRDNLSIDATESDTLYIEVEPDLIFTGRAFDDHHNLFDLIHTTADSTYYGEPVELRFEETPDSDFHVRVTRSSSGPSQREAGRLASNILYEYRFVSDTLHLAPYFSTPAADLFRGQQVEVLVLVPAGKWVHFGEQIGLIYWNDELAGETRLLEESEWSSSIRHSGNAIRITDDSTVVKMGNMEIRTSN
jgi:phage shock protein PspC (stress-responsive transcriptional regulator)